MSKTEEKIFEAFFYSKQKKLYFNQLQELTNASNSSLQNSIKKFEKDNLLKKEKTKSNTFYEIKDKKIFELEFSKISHKKFQNLNVNVKNPLRNFLKNIPLSVYTIVLFGSASRNEEKKNSDIDILIVTDNKTNFDSNKEEAQLTSKYPISIFQTNIKNFLENKDPIVVQAKKTGFPIYKQQNFYEVILDEY